MPTAWVDLVDVCRAATSSSSGRYDLVRGALRRQGYEVRGLADAALRTSLVPADVTLFDAAVTRGEVELVPDAAPHLLERVVRDGTATLVTGRRFRTLRGAFPELDGHPRVLRPSFRGTEVTLEPAPLDRLGHLDVSTTARVQQLAAIGYRGPQDHDLLLHDWRCRTASCEAATTAPQIEVLPHVDHGTAVCPRCSRPLQRLGPASAGVEVTLGTGGRTRRRVAVARGLALTVGCGVAHGDLDVTDLLAEDDGSFLVSREHLVVTNHDGRLRVRDAGSPAGSRLRSASGEVVDLRPGATTVLGIGEVVTLGGVLDVTVVPRRWTLAATAHPATAATPHAAADVGTVTAAAPRS
jgi:hypothetical protein